MSIIYESQIHDSAKVSISVLHANIFYCYAFIKIQRQYRCGIASAMNTEGKKTTASG